MKNLFTILLLLAGLACSGADYGDMTVKGDVAFEGAVSLPATSDSGWLSLTATPTTATSVDTHSATLVFAGVDYSTSVDTGNRFKADSSGALGDIYGIITFLNCDGGDTTMKIYTGQLTALTAGDSTIEDIYISRVKFPQGWSSDPNDWSEKSAYSSTTSTADTPPTAGVWYNVGGHSLYLPQGQWQTRYCCHVSPIDSGEVRATVKTTLSTANNSESDAETTCLHYSFFDGSLGGIWWSAQRTKTIDSTGANYFLNVINVSSSIDQLEVLGAVSPSIIEALSAYY